MIEHEVKINHLLDPRARAAIEAMRMFPLDDNYTDEQLEQIKLIDSGSGLDSFADSGLMDLITEEQFILAKNYLKSEKQYTDDLVIEVEILRLMTAAAWFGTRKPRFMSLAFGRAHEKYVNWRRVWNLRRAELEKLVYGDVKTVKGEWI